MHKILTALSSYFDWFFVPHITITDVLEIIILSYLLYHLMLWFKKTRAWTLLKGVVVLVAVMGMAAVLQLNTMLWIFKNAINVGILAVIILFQPELRRALEELGRKNIISDVLTRDDRGTKSDRLNDKTISELIAATIAMSKNKTGALIVLEREVALGEYESTGISIDAVVTKQLVVNIFEHNTPLHDGAVIVRNNRIVSATCYLPLTNQHDLNKELGTRHRAAIGISEVSDSMTIVVSEENGMISVAQGGSLSRNIDAEGLRRQLESLRVHDVEAKRSRMRKRGGKKREK